MWLEHGLGSLKLTIYLLSGRPRATTWSSATNDSRSNMLKRVSAIIRDELFSELQMPLPLRRWLRLTMKKKVAQFKQILDRAYKWRLAAARLQDHKFEPFYVVPKSLWVPDQMEPFERARSIIATGCTVISPVSLGLLRIEKTRDNHPPHVQQKAKVLLEEWLIRNKTAQRASILYVDTESVAASLPLTNAPVILVQPPDSSPGASLRSAEWTPAPAPGSHYSPLGVSESVDNLTNHSSRASWHLSPRSSWASLASDRYITERGEAVVSAL